MLKYIYFAIFLSFLGVGAIWYVNHTEKRVESYIEASEKLRAANARITEVNIQNVETIETMKKNYDIVVKEYNETIIKFNVINNQKQLLEEKLNEHDLGYLALNKPALIEKIINNSSTKALRCLELISGATLNEDEANATSANEFNSECPWLYDSFRN